MTGSDVPRSLAGALPALLLAVVLAAVAGLLSLLLLYGLNFRMVRLPSSDKFFFVDIPSSEGERFDALHHEAVTLAPVDSPSQDGVVVAVIKDGYTMNDESRGYKSPLFPTIDILNNGTDYITAGMDPFTPDNQLRYHTFQVQNNLTWYKGEHAITAGVTYEKYHSDNVFFNCCKQGAWVYNSLDDFYADARDALANPNRTTSPITARRYQVRYMNLPGLDKPSQPLTALYGGLYAGDNWRPKTNLTIMAGLRFDIPAFENTAYNNPNANGLTFRDENGQPVQYNSGKMPAANILWSPRVGFNYDINGDQKTQIRGGSGVFTGQPLYVWISNQLGNTGMLQGSFTVDNSTAYPFSTNVDKYKPAPTGQPATSYELNVTDNDFRFPQVWRSNIAIDRRLPGGWTGTAEYIYNRDVNGIYYINANLPAAQSAYVGADTRARYTSNRINNATGNQVTAAIVMKNQDRSSNVIKQSLCQDHCVIKILESFIKSSDN